MNIFFLHPRPEIAAKMHTRRHVVSQAKESMQLLAAAGHTRICKPTHENHPCAVWVRESEHNAAWLATLGWFLCAEKRIIWPMNAPHIYEREFHRLMTSLTHGPITPPAQAMPDDMRNPNPVTAYRTYYLLRKLNDPRDIAKYDHCTRGYPYTQDQSPVP